MSQNVVADPVDEVLTVEAPFMTGGSVRPRTCAAQPSPPAEAQATKGTLKWRARRATRAEKQRLLEFRPERAAVMLVCTGGFLDEARSHQVTAVRGDRLSERRGTRP